LISDLLKGVIAGLTATAPMTLTMEAMHRRLPPTQRYPLPPRRIAMEVAEGLGVERRLDESERIALAMALHFAYGAACGGVYGAIAKRLPLPPTVKGAAFGLAVWAASYAGWLPATGVFPPARTQPRRRNTLMIVAHLVWGASAGLLTDWLDEAQRRSTFSATGGNSSGNASLPKGPLRADPSSQKTSMTLKAEATHPEGLPSAMDRERSLD
jgi:uncharacterized membrane protein YagU involved in acid resistance